MPITHAYVSPVPDGADPNEVGPNEWNAAHTVPAHDELGGLADDDHAQYLLLAGRGAEQDVVGGVSVSTYLQVGSNGTPANDDPGDITHDGKLTHTPSAAQDITAAATAISVTAAVAQLTADGDYTLSAAPTIADGEDGQVVTIVNVDATNIITLQDQGTLANSNLRLAANTVALGPRDSIKLMYSSAVGDWIQIGYTDVL